MSRGETTLCHVALAGNPNVGKSSLFNAMTGLHQHTGNWPGKTVAVAQGGYSFCGAQYALTDLPGTYSLTGGSEEERIAGEYLQARTDGCIVAVCDATCLARSLALALQLMQRHTRVIVCVNLMDEAELRGIRVDLRQLELLLGVPVVGTCAGRAEDIRRLQQMIRDVMDGFVTVHTRMPEDLTTAEAVRAARRLAAQVSAQPERQLTRLERILTGRITGTLVCVGFLFLLFWLTLSGANVLSDLLQRGFDALLSYLRTLCADLPPVLSGLVIDGALDTTGRVTAVMLPPAAIFFFLFSMLEDAGYLPRAAFLTDPLFSRCGLSGRTALTMCMGLGCNAVGVTGSRIIPDRRERLLAIVTNNMVPCNGRFPMLLAMSTVICGGKDGAAQTLLVCGAAIAGMGGALISAAAGTKLFPVHRQPTFLLELPPFRRPRLRKILSDAICSKTLHVLSRAVVVAAPAGALLWLFANIEADGQSLLCRLAEVLQGPAAQFGMNGALAVGFLFALPANEMAIPVALMLTEGAAMQSAGLTAQLAMLGIGTKAAVCSMIFCVFHWPCSTTMQAIYHETGKVRWVVLAAALPTAIGLLLCWLVSLIVP